MELQGKLVEKMEPFTIQTKNGDKLKQIFVVRQPGQFGKDVAFECLSQDLISFLGDTKVGSEVNVKFDLSSRKWTAADGRVSFFTTAFAFGIEIQKSNGSTDVPVEQPKEIRKEQDADDLPF